MDRKRTIISAASAATLAAASVISMASPVAAANTANTALTCQKSGATTVSKAPNTASYTYFRWYDAKGQQITYAYDWSSPWSATTPNTAKRAVAVVYFNTGSVTVSASCN